jgi:RND superfamily putative drug exporter
MSVYLFRLGRFAYRRRRAVLAGWLLVLVAVIAISLGAGGKENNSFSVPNTESQNALNVLQNKLPAFSGGQTQVVFAAGNGTKVTDPAPKAAIESAVANLAHVPQVTVASDPFNPRLVSPDGQVALASVQFSASEANVKTSSLDAVVRAVAPARAAGLNVQYSGSVYPGSNARLSETPELVGILAAALILLVAFGSVVAAGVPIATALLGVVAALMGVGAVAAVVDVPSAATSLGLMLGLSTGIDYALFIVSRHRTNLLNGMSPEESVPLALGTAGGSVVFAALTVVIALAGLSVVGIPFLTVMGLSAAGAVMTALLIAITLLPALLGFAGQRVTRFLSLPGLRDHAERTARRAAAEPHRTWGARWARFVIRRRIPLLVGGVAALAVLTVPVAGIHLGLPGGESQPKNTTIRQASDLTTEHFGAGFNGPLLVVADTTSATSTGLAAVAQRLGTEPDVATVTTGAVQNGVSIVQVIPQTGPNDKATADLVSRIRHDRPTLEAGTGIRYLVGGTTASNIDTSAKLSAAMPVFLAVVVGLAFLLLTFAFRTILVPLKSIIGFLLSVGAAFGAQVAVFQWGWGASLLGVTPSETVSFLPVLLLAIIFGLSSDYEVFVVSRIKEDFTLTGDARGAVERGTGQSARVVSAAALIMFGVFVAFVFAADPAIKAIGFTLAVGVIFDAFVVRLTLVPAAMAILGSRLWYHPQWFARLVPDADIEGQRLEHQLVSSAA